MMKLWKRICVCLSLAAAIWCGSLIGERKTLNEELIRLHVVANSDSPEDQAIKLRVRDAVTASLQQELAKVGDMEEAKLYIQENLPKIQRIANQVLTAAGVEADVVVSLAKECFDTRYYDTFTLPAGVYEALRITIGEGEGKNWWCVVFPSLCIPAASEEFQEVAAGAGFSESLTATLEGEDGYEIRFFLLDALGRMENIFFQG